MKNDQLVSNAWTISHSSLHVCALPPSNAVNFVYYQVAAESSEYTFQIFTPANHGTYGLKATEEELIFEVSQI